MSSTKVQNRISFGKIKNLSETPDLLDIQLESFSEFFQLETTPDKRNLSSTVGSEAWNSRDLKSRPH